MNLDELREKRQQILDIADRHGAKSIRVFGSVVRGEATPSSDVDFLVEARQKHSSFFPGGLVMDLQDFLGCKVDVVEPAALHWYIKDKVLREAKKL